MKLAVDVSSILWTALRAGKDSEGQDVLHNGKKVHVNSAAYGYENAVNSVISCLTESSLTPIDMILVVEGVSSKSPRLAINPTYKGQRDDKPAEEYIEFQKLREMFVSAFRSVGAIAVSQDYAEGDDVLGFLAKDIEEDLLIQTNDGDMAVLNGVNAYGANIMVRINGVLGVNKCGDFPHKYITVYKAFVGDRSDSITGIPGFGPKAWEVLWSRFGTAGLDLLIGYIENGSLDPLHDEAKQDEFVNRIYSGAADLINSYKLAKIYPNWVNTMHNPLQWRPGMVGKVKDARLTKWQGVRRLVVAENWDTFVPWALSKLAILPWFALDIETSTPVESDDWLEALGDPDGVDVIGSELTGMSLTFGDNSRYTVYIAVDHKQGPEATNVSTNQLRDFLIQVFALNKRVVIHNTNFEGPVLHNLWGADWVDNGYEGFIPNWYDTKYAASYVDENFKLGLKALSKRWLDYDQVDYATTTTLLGPFTEGTGGKYLGDRKVIIKPAVWSKATERDVALATLESGTLQVGQEFISEPEVFEMVEARQFKMRELTAQHVFDYACDDTVTTAGLYNFFQLVMSLEHTAKILEQVELDASYLHAQAFTVGTLMDAAKLQILIKEDRAEYDKAKVVLDSYLVEKGWDGTVCPVFTADLKPADIKAAYLITTGDELETAVRTPSKMVALFKDQRPMLAGLIEIALKGDPGPLNELVKQSFTGAPVLNLGSPKQLQKLLYETLALPIEIYNAPTDAMKKRGEVRGTPKTDNLAITYALVNSDEKQTAVLEALRIMKMVNYRFSLYYDTISGFVHWKTGRVHSNHNQCATNTRRASSSKPNLQQLSKNEKVEGFSPRVRELYIPHKKGAVIVSFDFNSQELVLMAEWSRDPALVACFVGEKPTDMHSKTGVGIYNGLHGSQLIYDEFVIRVKDEDHPEHKRAKKARALGKAVNFGGQYRVAAKKLSTMLMVTETEAQAMIDAKAEAFPVVEEWSLNEMAAAQNTGIVKTLLGAVRHLRDAVMSSDRVVSSKAPRQALSYRIQGSAAEQTKLAEGRMWKAKLTRRYDCQYFAPVHDECVWSVMLEDLEHFIPEVHKLMTAPYATMTMPINSSVSVGYSFGEQMELNGDFSKANIYKKLGLTTEVVQ